MTVVHIFSANLVFPPAVTHLRFGASERPTVAPVAPLSWNTSAHFSRNLLGFVIPMTAQICHVSCPSFCVHPSSKQTRCCCGSCCSRRRNDADVTKAGFLFCSTETQELVELVDDWRKRRWWREGIGRRLLIPIVSTCVCLFVATYQ